MPLAARAEDHMESNDFLQMEGGKIALVLDAKDNVAVALADVGCGEPCRIRGRGYDYDLRAAGDIGFGHKVALCALKAGDPIYKYGEEIGVARESIPAGGWIHSHNLYCERGM
jgi:hypothetical protein